MKFLSNIYDPSCKDAYMYHVAPVGISKKESWRQHLKWVNDHVIGDPMPTEHCTIEELKKANMVGVYSK